MHPSDNRQQPGVSNRGRERRPYMVRLDHQLLFVAHSLLNGANVHRLKELIFAYEQAVDLHNRQSMRHEIYRMHSEIELRNYVRGCHEAEIERRTVIAINRASVAASNSIALADIYHRLEERLAECAVIELVAH
jgi:hypothetical protein